MVGLLVNRVEDMVMIDHSDINPPPANVGDVADRYISGVVKLENDLLNILHIKEIVAYGETLTSHAA